MSKRAAETLTPSIELVREGKYVVEVDVTLIETSSEWSPYYSLEDAENDVRTIFS